MFPKFSTGKRGEEYTKLLLDNVGFKCELNTDYQKRYDYDLTVKMGKVEFTIECKYDVMSLKTGNLAIEYFNSKSNTASGITVTKSDIWVQLIPEKNSQNILAYAISTSKLRCFIESVQPFKIVVGKGDGNSDMMIYRMDAIIPEFSRFDNVTDKKIMKAIFSELLLEKV